MVVNIKGLFSIFLILLVLSLPSSSGAKTLPAGAGSGVPPDVLIIVDTSGSMTFDTYGCTGRTYTYNNITTTLGLAGDSCGTDNGTGTLVGDAGGAATWGDGSAGIGITGETYWGRDQGTPNPPSTTLDTFTNDSRLYIAKNALSWLIPQADGIRFALSRYHQNQGDQAYPNAAWYRKSPYSSTNTNRLTLNYAFNSCADSGSSTNTGKLLADFPGITNATNSNHSSILRWMDHSENYGAGDYELRADGATPIGGILTWANTFLTSTQNTDNTNGIACRNYYVILLTDGNETCGGNPVAAAQTLHNNGFNVFVIGFAIQGGQASINAIAQAGGTDANTDGDNNSATGNAAFFANNPQQLQSALQSIIGTIQSENLTATAPVIMPSFDSNSKYFYMTKFLPKEFHQWEGRILAYEINNSTGFPNTTPLWDAGEILGLPTSTYGYICSDGCANSRSIWTVDSTITSGLNNFSLTNTALLKPLLGYGADADAINTNKLINFVRGKDAFDENINSDTNEDRWKLADIYHSTPMEVRGPANYYFDNNYPTFKNTYSSRRLMLYAGGNDGMLHAFSARDGLERWAFIPPDLLGKLKNMVSAIPNQSISQYYVDLPPIVDDVYINGPGGTNWRTVLIGGERQGDHGLFALDVTNPESPAFLWDLSHDRSIASINYWQSNGTFTAYNYTDYVNADTRFRDYKGLGETWSVPVIGRLKTDNSDVFALFFGGGYDNVNAGVGNKVFVSKVEDASILRAFDLGDSAGDGIKNMAISSPGLLFEDATGKDYIQFMYIGDQEGQMWKMDVRKTDPSTWTNCIFFDALADSTNERYINITPELSYDSGKQLWVYFGTGDIYNPEKSTAVMDNRFFAVRDDNVRLYYGSSSGDCPSPQITFADLSDVSAQGVSIGTNRKGWHVDLQRGNGEKVMGSIIWGGLIFFTTYVPNNNDVCDSGDAYLYALDAFTGADPPPWLTNGTTNTNNQKILRLGKGQPSLPVIRKGADGVYRIYVTLTTQNPDASYVWGVTGSGVKDYTGMIQLPSQGGGAVFPKEWRELY